MKREAIGLQRRPQAETGAGYVRREFIFSEAPPTEPSSNVGGHDPLWQTGSTVKHSGSNSSQVVERHSTVPRTICFDLKNVYAPEGFDPTSSVLACGFPGGTSIATCRKFFSWIGPVICVERAPSYGSEANFVVVFSSDEWAHIAARQPLPFDSRGTIIACRLVDHRPTLLESWIPSWTVASSRSGVSTTPPQVGSGFFLTAPPSTIVSTNPLGSVTSLWNNFINSPSLQNTGNTLSHIGSRIAEQAEQGRHQASIAYHNYMRE